MHCFWDILGPRQSFIDNVIVQHVTGSHGYSSLPKPGEKKSIKVTFSRDGSDFVNVCRSL